MEKRQRQRHMALLLAAVLLLPVFAAPSSGHAEQPYSLACQVGITNADNFAAPITRSSPVALTFQLQLSFPPAEHFGVLTSETFYIYLLRGLFAGSEQIDIVNPACGASPEASYASERIFAADSLTREPDRDTLIDGLEFDCYSIRLNGSARAQAYYEAEAPTQLSFGFTKLLGQGVSATPGQKVALVMNANGDNLGEGSIAIADAAEAAPLPACSLDIALQARYVWDAAFQPDASGTETGAYAADGETDVCAPGDLLVFQLNLANETEAPLTLLSLTQHLPDGYRLPDWSSPRLIARDGALQAYTEGSALLPAGASGEWAATEHAQEYRYTFETPLVLSPGESTSLYMLAEVTQGSNLLYTISALQDNGAQPVATYEPMRSGQHDLALTAKIVDVYNEYNEPVASYPDTRPVPAISGARMGVRLRVENQGPAARGISVVAYVPLGFSVLPDTELFADGSSNAGWAPDKQLPRDDANGIWSDIAVYRYTFPQDTLLQTGETAEAVLYVAVQGAIGERKPGGYPEDVYLPADYYIAGELCAFQDADGAPATDADSTPDSDPANDLFDNRTGITRYHPITLYQKVQEGSYMGEVKEFPGSTTGRARLRYGLLQDEDDFDFDYAAPAKSGVPQQEYGPVLTTRRLPAAQTAALVTQHFGEGAYAALAGAAGLAPAQDDGVLRSTRSYMLYELWLNRDGLLDMAGGSLELALPEGQLLLSHAQGGAAYDLLRLYQYHALQRAPGMHNPSRQIIRYEPGCVAEREILFPQGGDPGSLQNAYLLPDAAAPQPEDMAAAYGITATVAEDRRTVRLQFGTPSGGLRAHADTMAAYRLLFVAAVDQQHIQYTPMQARATFHHKGGALTSEEETPLTWGDANTPFLRLDTWDAAAGQFVRSPVFAVVTPGQDGQLLARYRLRFRSEFALEPNSLYLSNAIPEDQFLSFSNISVTGYRAPVFDATGESTTPAMGSNLPVLARADSRSSTLHIRNTLPTGDDQYYDVCYDVQYRNIRYGQLLRNSAGGAATQLITPLLLSISNRDARSDAVLAGCSFALYYAAADGSADLARPVRATNGRPVQFDGDAPDAYFLPEGYAPGAAQSWQVVLVQTGAPAAYSNQSGRAVPLHIASNDAGDLEISAATGSGYALHTSALGAAQLDISHIAPSAISIYVGARGNAANALGGAVFLLTRPDGSTELLPATGRNGRTAFQPNTTSQAGYAGSYVLESMTPPQAYAGLAAGRIRLQLHEDGSLAAVQAEGTDAGAAYLNSDFLSLSVLFSPLSQPTLLYVDANSGAPLAGAQFMLTQSGGGRSAPLETDRAGRALLATGLPPGEYALEQRLAPGAYAPLHSALHLTIREDGSMQLPQMATPATISANGYCLRIAAVPLPSAGALPLGGLPTPTPAPAPQALLQGSTAQTQAAGPLPASGRGQISLPAGAPQPEAPRGLLLGIACLLLLAEVLLLYNCVRRRNHTKEQPHE